MKKQLINLVFLLYIIFFAARIIGDLFILLFRNDNIEYTGLILYYGWIYGLIPMIIWLCFIIIAIFRKSLNRLMSLSIILFVTVIVLDFATVYILGKLN
jgi:hypothetical protein